jgi:hypothetical protein
MTRSVEVSAPRKDDIWREKRLRPTRYEPRYVRVLSIDEGRVQMWGVEASRGVWLRLPRRGRKTSYTITLKEFAARFTLQERNAK